MASVHEVWRYPVKSMAGERLDSCEVAETGLVGDRRWALVDGSPNRAGKPLTIRENEQLMTYRARLGGRGVEVVRSSAWTVFWCPACRPNPRGPSRCASSRARTSTTRRCCSSTLLPLLL